MTRACRSTVRPRRRKSPGDLPIGRTRRASLLRTALLLLGTFPFLACDDDPAANEEPGAAADVTGTVAQVKTGAGVPNLVVALVRDGVLVDVAATDAAGRFAFDDVPNGTYRAVITGLELSALSLPHTALEPPLQEFTVAGEPVELAFAAVGLIPPRILGFVTCAGQPVVGTSVRVLGGRDDVTVVTNDQGKYAAIDLDTGHHVVLLPDPPCGGPEMRMANLLPGQSVEVDFAH